MLLPFAAWQGEEWLRSVAADLEQAMRATPHPMGGFYDQDRMAREMGISPQLLSMQLAGLRPLDVWKVARMPTGFHVRFYTLRLKRLAYEVIAPGELQELIGSVRRLLRRRRPATTHASAEEKAKVA